MHGRKSIFPFPPNGVTASRRSEKPPLTVGEMPANSGPLRIDYQSPGSVFVYFHGENAKGGITVNAICPGYINTEMVQAVPKEVLEKSILPLIPISRLGEPEEIARAVVFLAADDAGAITGSTLTINGGQYMV